MFLILIFMILTNILYGQRALWFVGLCTKLSNLNQDLNTVPPLSVSTAVQKQLRLFPVAILLLPFVHTRLCGRGDNVCIGIVCRVLA